MSLVEHLELEWEYHKLKSDFTYPRKQEKDLEKTVQVIEGFRTIGSAWRAISLSKGLVKRVADDYLWNGYQDPTTIMRALDSVRDVFIFEGKYKSLAKLCELAVEKIESKAKNHTYSSQKRALTEAESKTCRSLLLESFQFYTLAGKEKKASKIKKRLESEFGISHEEIFVPSSDVVFESKSFGEIGSMYSRPSLLDINISKSEGIHPFKYLGVRLMLGLKKIFSSRANEDLYLEAADKFYAINATGTAKHYAKKTVNTARKNLGDVMSLRVLENKLSYYFREVGNIFFAEGDYTTMAKLCEQCAVDVGVVVRGEFSVSSEFFLANAAQFYSCANNDYQAEKINDKIAILNYFYPKQNDIRKKAAGDERLAELMGVAKPSTTTQGGNVRSFAPQYVAPKQIELPKEVFVGDMIGKIAGAKKQYASQEPNDDSPVAQI
ncbi:hypothetical protein HN587_02005 [Candidatus Woesearchaeota archaeon]|jgi:hypothetical protein|nr:hypothetical protein [Candidatus Woesearchaeota archaeon]